MRPRLCGIGPDTGLAHQSLDHDPAFTRPRMPGSSRSSAWIRGAPYTPPVLGVDLLDLLDQPARWVRRRPRGPIGEPRPTCPPTCQSGKQREQLRPSPTRRRGAAGGVMSRGLYFLGLSVEEFDDTSQKSCRRSLLGGVPVCGLSGQALENRADAALADRLPFTRCSQQKQTPIRGVGVAADESVSFQAIHQARHRAGAEPKRTSYRPRNDPIALCDTRQHQQLEHPQTARAGLRYQQPLQRTARVQKSRHDPCRCGPIRFWKVLAFFGGFPVRRHSTYFLARNYQNLMIPDTEVVLKAVVFVRRQPIMGVVDPPHIYLRTVDAKVRLFLPPAPVTLERTGASCSCIQPERRS